MKKIFLILSILLFSVPVSKATVWGHFDCGVFLSKCEQSKTDPTCEGGTFYTLGVISAHSTNFDQNMKGKFNNFDNVKYALIKYCKANPFSDTYDAAVDIFDQLRN